MPAIQCIAPVSTTLEYNLRSEGFQVRLAHSGRQGLASAMLAELYARVNDEGARFTLEVRRSNDVAIRLYEREGFRAAGTRRRYYQDNGEDALVMWRTPATLADPSGIAPLHDVPNPGPV